MSDGGGAGGTLRLDRLTISRGGRPVVHGVSLDIPPGQVTALLGPNGAGKSSLVLAVGGIVRADSGSIALDDDDFVGWRPERIRRAGVAVVPEGRRLLRELSVQDNLQVATYMLSRAEAKAGVAYALELFPELDRRLSIASRSLSGGEQQMLVLAQALVSKPRFILIDELSLGLAPVIVQRLVPTVRRVAESGVGVLLIEQFAKVALELATGAYIMEGGRIQYSGTAAELQQRPELLESAYLLGGAELEADPDSDVPAPLPAQAPPAPAAPAPAPGPPRPPAQPAPESS
jgi:branched-chain amino acid transport system ATP-binding protein